MSESSLYYIRSEFQFSRNNGLEGTPELLLLSKKERKKEREKFRGGEKTNAMSLKSTRLNFASRSNRIDQTREAFLFQNHSSTVVMRVLLINKLLFFAYIMFILILQQYRNI
jgi:hypothetical protein